MKAITILKIGGNVLNDRAVLEQLLDDFSRLEGMKILVHGGGRKADELIKELGILPLKVDGRRITDAATLDIVVMVYAGLLNKTIVAALQGRGCAAIGLCGADGNVVLAHKRRGTAIDYGFVGDVDAVNAPLVLALLQQGLAPVFSAITHDGQGQLLNTNADTIAAELAIALAPFARVTLAYCFEKKGVLRNPQDDDSVIHSINEAKHAKLVAEGVVTEGMIPKLDNAFAALRLGLEKVVIGGPGLLSGVGAQKGTTLVL